MHLPALRDDPPGPILVVGFKPEEYINVLRLEKKSRL
jgi:hypothetical protein